MKPNDLNPSNLQPIAQDKEAFSEILRLIVAARQRAFHAINTELIDLYWQVGAIISRKIEAAEWGDGVVDQLAGFIAKTQPGVRGFTRANLFRMRQFYEIYRDEEKSRATGATIAMGTKCNHLRAVQTPRGARILSSLRRSRTLEQARAGTSD